MFISWFDAIFQFLLPSTCLSCQASIEANGCCADCKAALPWLSIACDRCATPLVEAGLCGLCDARPPAFSHAIIPFVYASPVNSWLAALKFHEQLALSSFLADALLQKLLLFYQNKPWPQLIIPVPLHAKRLQQRGYNQAVLIAAYLARRLYIPLSRHSLVKVRATVAQTTLSKAARKTNLKHAFALDKIITATHVAIVDDVFTTGATVNEIASLLRRKGISQVDVWCVARTTHDVITLL
jgi:ComF family protein